MSKKPNRPDRGWQLQLKGAFAAAAILATSACSLTDPHAGERPGNGTVLIRGHEIKLYKVERAEKEASKLIFLADNLKSQLNSGIFDRNTMSSQLLEVFLACVNNQDYLPEDTWKKVAASLEDLYQSHRFVRVVIGGDKARVVVFTGGSCRVDLREPVIDKNDKIEMELERLIRETDIVNSLLKYGFYDMDDMSKRVYVLFNDFKEFEKNPLNPRQVEEASHALNELGFYARAGWVGDIFEQMFKEAFGNTYRVGVAIDPTTGQAIPFSSDHSIPQIYLP